MQRTPGAVRVAVFLFVALCLLPCAPRVSARDLASGLPESSRLAVSAAAAPRVHDKLTVTEQQIGGKNFHIGKLAVDAPKEQIWGILTDYDAATCHFSYLKKCTRLKEKTGQGGQLISFTAKTGVGPITIDYTLEVKETESAGLIEWRRHSGAFKANEGYWKLESVDDGKRTLITYAKHVEAGFPLPNSMVNKAVKDSMPIIFGDLHASLNRIASAKSNKAAIRTPSI
jgi:uncharacterized membrane protein